MFKLKLEVFFKIVLIFSLLLFSGCSSLNEDEIIAVTDVQVSNIPISPPAKSESPSSESPLTELPVLESPKTVIVDEKEKTPLLKPTENLVVKAEPLEVNNSVMVQVDIKSFSFKPNSVTIKVGDMINWTNYDSTKHTATSDNNIFNSKLLAQGKSWSYKFEKTGTYGYYCQPHTSMRGIIIVE